VTTFITAGVALVLTPIISVMTQDAPRIQIDQIWKAKKTSEEESTGNIRYHILPTTAGGKFGLGLLGFGFIVFLTGVVLGSTGAAVASTVAVTGMFLYFAGGLVRAFRD